MIKNIVLHTTSPMEVNLIFFFLKIIFRDFRIYVITNLDIQLPNSKDIWISKGFKSA